MTEVPPAGLVTDCLREVAQREILPRFKTLKAEDIRRKSAPWDLVTVADTEAEKALARALERILPGSRTVGEEGTEEDPSLLSLLREDRPVWVVDPVDGTRNFANGNKYFAVIVALVRAGRTLAGWIHDPLAGETVHAVSGGGAWLGDTRLEVLPSDRPENMRGALGTAARRHRESRAARPGEIVRYYCTGLEQAHIARGRLHYAHYAKRLKPWDHAAGVLICEEAGGYCALRDAGEAYRPTGIVETRKGLLFAPDATSWEILHQLLP